MDTKLKGLPMVRRKVLIIDDESLILQTTSILLRHFDMDAVAAANGLDGIEMAKNEKPDVILLDLVMPVMDGWSVLEKLKSDDGLSKIPVVMLTGDSQSVTKNAVGEKGVAGVCYKPFQPEKLKALIEELCSDKPSI